MGILDDLLWNLFSGPQLAGRRGGKILREGDAGEATVVGIQTDRSAGEDESQPQYTYALEVRCGAEVFRCGLRQPGLPRTAMHVGAVVPVRVLKGRVVVDEGVEREGKVYLPGWKMKDAPADGVEDRYSRRDQKRIAGARPARVTVLALHEIGPAVVDKWADVLLVYGDTGENEQRRLKVRPPDYASYLLQVGLILPCGVDKDGKRVTLDWEAAANEPAFDPSPPAVDPSLASQPVPGLLDSVLGGIFG